MIHLRDATSACEQRQTKFRKKLLLLKARVCKLEHLVMIQYQDVTGKDWLYLEQQKFSGFFPSHVHLAVRRKQAGGSPSLALLSAGNPLALCGTLTDVN